MSKPVPIHASASEESHAIDALRTEPRATWMHAVLVVVVLLGGLLLRSWNLGDKWMFRDEAESGINALTILQHGVPRGDYLGLPIYENTLMKPWPDSAEYEFKDSSYNDKGVAVYHGWLPLYAMAASFEILDVKPDVASGTPRVLHSEAEMRARARAARLPSVVFALVFLLAVYACARTMAGADAGLAALVIAALLAPCVEYAREARYHSATLAFSTLSFFAVWQIARSGRWRDYLLLSAALVLLFYSYAVAFVLACAMCAIVSPWAMRRSGAIVKCVVALVLVAGAIVPWLMYANVLGHETGIPSARSMLQFPRDYFTFLANYTTLVAGVGAVVAWMAIVFLAGRRMPERIARPFREKLPAVALAVAWIVAGYLVFAMVIPASSFFMGRSKLGLLGPAIVLMGVMLSAAGRAIGPRAIRWMPAVAMFGVLALSGRNLWGQLRPVHFRQPGFAFAEQFDALNLDANTRMYAIPYENLPLMFAAGLPIQNVAPIRKSFLDEYPARVILIDSVPRSAPVTTDDVTAAAREANVSLAAKEAADWASRLSNRATLEDAAATGAIVDPPLEDLPAFAQKAVDRACQRARTPDNDGLWQNPAIFRGYESYDWASFWTTFFYRFKNPAARAGLHANFAERIRGSRATLLKCGWVLYDCAPKSVAADSRLTQRPSGSDVR